MTTLVEQVLRNAIADRRVVALIYEGDTGPERVVHPHALFRSSTDKLLISIFQVDGFTTTGGLPQWRDLAVTKITDESLRTATFDIASGFDLSHPKYQHGLLAYVRP